MEADRFGCPLSTTSAVAAESYTSFVDAMLASSEGAESFASAAIAADEGFALARIGDAFLRFTTGDVPGARERAGEATELAPGATLRERHHIATVAAIVSGDVALSTELVGEHVAEFPLDRLMVFVAQGRFTFSGRKTWKHEIAALTEAVAPHYDPNEWSMLGMKAFRAEEERDINTARDLAERSLDLYPENARAAHVLAHTFFESGAHPAGYAFLAPWIEGHHPSDRFGGHLWWHVALHQLGLGDRTGTVETLRTGIASAGRIPFRVPDVASLLWRLDLYGLDADPTDWEAASDLAAEVVRNPGFAFVDAHVALAHAGAHRVDRLNEFIAQIETQAANGNDLAAEVLLPLATGIGAFAQGRPDVAAQALGGLVATGDLVRIGGSNAQREVFEDTLIAAYVAVGDHSAARSLLDERLARRTSPIDERWKALATVR